MAVALLFLLPGSTSTLVKVALLACTVGPSVVIAAVEMRRSSRRKPWKWLPRAVSTAVPQAFGLYVAGAAGGAPTWLSVAVCATVAVVQIASAAAAASAARRRVATDARGPAFDVRVKIRRDDPAQVLAVNTRWLALDKAYITADTMHVELSLSMTRRICITIPLATLSRAYARPAQESDNPWYVGHGLRFEILRPIDLLVLQRPGFPDAVLPVFDAVEVAALVQTRIQSVADRR